jgi:hypothetical protein
MALGKIDRLIFCGLYRLSPTVLDALKVLRPEAVILASRWFPSLLALEIAHQNTHLSMWLKGRGFPDRDAIPRDVSRSAARASYFPAQKSYFRLNAGA